MNERSLQGTGAVLGLLTAAVILAGQYRPVEQPAALGVLVALVAALAAAAVTYLAVVRPWWGLLAWLAVIPLINMARAQVWIGPIQVISTTPILIGLAVGVIVWRWRRPPEAGAPGLAWWLLGAAAALAVLSTVAAPLDAESVNITFHGLLEPFAVLGCVLALRPDSRRTLQALAAVAAGVVAAACVNLGYLFGTIGSGSFYERRFLYARLTYFNVGIFGGMLVATMVHLGSVMVGRDRLGWPRWVTPVAWIGMGIAIVAIFFTYTKSAWVAAAIGLGLVVALLVQGWLRRAALLVAIAALLAVVIPYPMVALERISPDLADGYYDFVVSLQSQERVESWDPETAEGSGSVGIRWVALSASAELVGQNPLLGVGPGQFGEAFREIRPSASVPRLSSAHNLLPNIAVEYGLPLALLITFAFAYGVIRGLPTLDRPDLLRRTAAMGVAITLVAFNVFSGLFGGDLYRTFRTMNTDVILEAVLVGLAISLGTEMSAGSAGGGAAGQLADPLDQA